MASPPTGVSARLLREHLQKDIITREASIARFMSWMTGGSAVAALALIPVIGVGLALSIAGFVGVLCVYYVVTGRVMRGGRFPPALQWLNTAVMVSIPAVVFLADLRFQGAQYALTTPPLVAWGALIVVSALRAGRALAYAGAALAAIEYFALYYFLARPQLPPDVLSTLTPPLMLVRALFLFAYGPLTATLAGHLLRKAEEALKAVRERDFMGKYFLHERVGVGGMAEVFRATYSPEGGFEKVVAVKRVLPAYAQDKDFVTLFRREAELGAMLTHPSVVQVLDLGRHADTVFLAMEYVEGLSLGTLLERLPDHRLPPAAVAYLGAEIAGALQYVHTRRGAQGEPLGLVHRDLNPPNILVSSIGEVKLTDFGIARAGNRAGLTQHGGVRGKAGYLAPEQAMGEELDGRTDLFALGLTLHEALTGQPAFQGATELELMKASLEAQLMPPSARVDGVPPGLDAAVMGLLVRDRERRTANGAALQRQLLDLEGPIAPYPHGREALVAALRQVLPSAQALPVRPSRNAERPLPARPPTAAQPAPVAPISTVLVAPEPEPVNEAPRAEGRTQVYGRPAPPSNKS
jgi:serine/threonine-protein kinase